MASLNKSNSNEVALSYDKFSKLFGLTLTEDQEKVFISHTASNEIKGLKGHKYVAYFEDVEQWPILRENGEDYRIIPYFPKYYISKSGDIITDKCRTSMWTWEDPYGNFYSKLDSSGSFYEESITVPLRTLIALCWVENHDRYNYTHIKVIDRNKIHSANNLCFVEKPKYIQVKNHVADTVKVYKNAYSAAKEVDLTEKEISYILAKGEDCVFKGYSVRESSFKKWECKWSIYGLTRETPVMCVDVNTGEIIFTGTQKRIMKALMLTRNKLRSHIINAKVVSKRFVILIDYVL